MHMKKRVQPGIEELFDIVGQEFGYQEKYFSRHLQQMSQFCNCCLDPSEIRGRVCLDAGCGTGTASIHFARSGARQVTGIDLSRKSLQVAHDEATQRVIANTLLANGDLGALPFANDTFDLVYSCGAFPYVDNPYHCLSELIRVTKSNGCIVLMALRKSRFDTLYEIIRRIFSRTPGKFRLAFARLFALVSYLPANYFLGRRVIPNQGKPLAQTILEAFFSPVRLKKLDVEEISNYLMSHGFTSEEVSGFGEMDFYSAFTCFVIKAVKNRARGNLPPL